MVIINMINMFYLVNIMIIIMMIIHVNVKMGIIFTITNAYNV